jgi:hypothetical protein
MNLNMKCGAECCRVGWLSWPNQRGGRVAETERDALFQVLDVLEALQIPYWWSGRSHRRIGAGRA